MYKYLVLAVFITIFFFLIKKDRVYVVPLILVIFSNINGLLDGEDFAFHGVIKFQDYGLLLTLILLFLWGVSKKTKTPGYERDMKNNMLYRIILFYWGYYLSLIHI